MIIKIFTLQIFIFLVSFSNAAIPPAFVDGTTYGVSSTKNSCITIVKIKKIEIATSFKIDLSIEACKQISISCDFLEKIIEIQFQNDELKKGRLNSAINNISQIRKSTKYLPYEYDTKLPDDIKFLSTEAKVKTIQLLLDNLANDFDALVNGEPKNPEVDRLLEETFQHRTFPQK